MGYRDMGRAAMKILGGVMGFGIALMFLAAGELKAQSCMAEGFVGGSVYPTTVTSGSPYQLSCNYGAVYDYVYGNNCDSFAGWQGTTAVFNCTAPTTPGNYAQSCQLGYGPTQYLCPRDSDSAGTLTVTSSSSQGGSNQENYNNGD